MNATATTFSFKKIAIDFKEITKAGLAVSVVFSLKSIAIFLKENVVAVAFIKVLKTAAKVLYRKRFDKKRREKNDDSFSM